MNGTAPALSHHSKVAVIINPIAGGVRPAAARRRVEYATRFIAQHRLDGEVLVTTRPGHARELAQQALARQATLVIAWGGDGTVSEVASALAFSPAVLAVVPSGSGNGLARELGIPRDPHAALGEAIAGEVMVMDAGEIDGRLFFNVAGIGFDARVAERFAAGGAGHRGPARYLTSVVRELFRYDATEYVVSIDGKTSSEWPLLMAIANSRQYGNGALIAPKARIDDGRLDVVIVDDRSPLEALVQAGRLFLGTLEAGTGVSMTPAIAVEVSAEEPILFHLDGEPHIGGSSVVARVRPGALRVVCRSGRGRG